MRIHFALVPSVLSTALFVQACQQDVIALAPAKLKVHSSSLDFGDVPVGEFRKMRVVISVEGESYVDLEAPVLRDQDRPVFEVTSDTEPGRVKAGASMTLEVTYRPPSLGPDAARLTLDFSQGGQAANIDLLGRAICPDGQIEVDAACRDEALYLDAGTRDASLPDAELPPQETCDGRDDDGDGACDEGFGCCAGSTVACTTTCGSEGMGMCTATCGVPVAESCTPPAFELCNGVDDTCDCRVDEGCPNLLANPGFDAGDSAWTHWVDGANGAAATFVLAPGAGCDGGDALRIDITSVVSARCGAYPCAHTIELRQVGLPAIEGKRPRVALRVRSEGVPAISVGFRQLCGGACGAPACPAVCPEGSRNETDPFSCCWEPYAGPEYSVQLTGSGWQTLTYTFPPIVIDGPDDVRQDGRVLLGVGTGVGTLFIDDLHLELVD